MNFFFRHVDLSCLICPVFVVEILLMKSSFRIVAILMLAVLASCAPNRTPFSPGGPTTVGMPAELSDRERAFIPDIDSALRREGLVPVKSGKGDLQLDFSMAAGPINIDTLIAMKEDDAVLFTGKGRAAGAPLIGRSSVAEKSFNRAFDEFNTGLSRAAGNRGWSSSSSHTGSPQQDYSQDSAYTEDNLQVY